MTLVFIFFPILFFYFGKLMGLFSNLKLKLKLEFKVIGFFFIFICGGVE